MPQPHVVKRGSRFYFRIAVPLSLLELVGKREIKASLRTSDAMSAKMRGRVLSNRLELLFRELRSMSEISTEVILNRARDYFRVQLSKSLELAFLLPTDSKVDLGREVAGTKLFEAKLREELKYQCFSQSIQSDAFTLLHPTNPDPDAKPSDAFQIACNAILRAKIENARILVARSCRPATVGDQRDSNNSDARYSCIFLDRRATSGVAAPRHCVQAALHLRRRMLRGPLSPGRSALQILDALYIRSP